MRHVAISLIILTSAAGAIAPAADPPDGDTAAVLDAFKKRQEQVRSLVVEFERTDTIAPGAMTRLAGTPDKAPIPAEEVTLKSKGRLVIDGDKVRYEDNHPRCYSNGKQALWPQVIMFDGVKGTRLLVGNNSVPVGSILTGLEWKAELTQDRIAGPLLTTFRGLDSSLSLIPLDGLQPSPDPQPAGDDPGKEFVFPVPGRMPASVWFDSAKDHVVNSLRHTPGQRSWESLDVRYHRDSQGSWVPESWTWTIHDQDGAVLRTDHTAVTRCGLNALVDGKEFASLFSPGLIVEDHNTFVSYRVQADGSLTEDPPRLNYVQVKWIEANRWVEQNQGWLVQAAGLVGIFVVMVVVLGVATRRWTKPKGI